MLQSTTQAPAPAQVPVQAQVQVQVHRDPTRSLFPTLGEINKVVPLVQEEWEEWEECPISSLSLGPSDLAKTIRFQQPQEQELQEQFPPQVPLALSVSPLLHFSSRCDNAQGNRKD